MTQLLSPGTTLQTEPLGLPCVIDQFLGGGAQGEVYRATMADQPVAVKWYFPQYRQQDRALRNRLERLVRDNAPTDRFLWPLALALQADDEEGFGYVMLLRPANFVSMNELVTRQVAPSFRVLITTGFELAYHFRQLHAKGLCYRDIAFGNLFFDPATGEVRIGDNDNVDINNTPGAINGTPRFMAPEIVRGEAEPTAETDLFSLATLLFYLLCNHHPLEGARELVIHCFDQPAMTRLYGFEPRFIFDPTDPSNRPVPGEQDNPLIFWPLYPQAVRDRFTQAFTAGMQPGPQGRVRESEWCSLLLQVRDALLYCTACGAENFYDPARLRAAGALHCWGCQQALRLPPRLRLSHGSTRWVVLLNHDTHLYAYHLDPARPFEQGEALAAVRQHPNHPELWGLQNRSGEKWVSATADGTLREVPPGRSVTLAAGTRLYFGTSEAEIRV